MLVSVQLTPAGVPQRVVVRQQVFTRATASAAAEKALVQEALRVSQLLRFCPQAGAGDSLVFPVIFFCCN
jgi:hypothetical protein